MRIGVRTLVKRSSALVGAAALITAVAGGVGAADGHGGQGQRGAETQEIASSVLGHDVKYTLTAIRSTKDPLLASVRLKVFVERGGVFDLSDQTLVGKRDGFFWFPLTGRGAICQFSTASTDPAPIAVSLLITPAIGCSPAQHFTVRDGKFTSDGTPTQQPHGAMHAGGGAMAEAVAPKRSRRA
jgi:hypothetical protein